MLDWLGIPRHLPSLFLRTLSFQLRSTSSSLLLHSCIQTVCIWTWPARNRDDSHTDFGETLPLYSGQVTKLLSVIPAPPPLCIRLTEPSGTQPIYSGCHRSIYIRGRDVLISLGSTASARPIEMCG